MIPDINHCYKCSACGELYGVYDVHDCIVKREAGDFAGWADGMRIDLAYPQTITQADISFLSSIGAKWDT